jgi:hypothetical protein
MQVLSSILLVLACLGCVKVPEDNRTSVVILIDYTDPLRIRPHSKEILALCNLDKDIWQGVRIVVSPISDEDINPTSVLELEEENRLLGNTKIRTAKVERFKRELALALEIKDTVVALSHSIIYRASVKLLNDLSASKAKHKHFLIYSNLMENSEVSFYDAKTRALLQNDPKEIQALLEKSTVLNNLTTINIWLLYDPVSYEDNATYMLVANRLYKQLLLGPKGAIVHIEKSLTR